MTENKIDSPVLTLNPASMAQEKAELENAAAQLESLAEPAAPAWPKQPARPLPKWIPVCLAKRKSKPSKLL